MGKMKFKILSEDGSSNLTKVTDVKTETKKKFNVRARKLYHPFMAYLKSYSVFAEALPHKFFEFDEEKLAEVNENNVEGEEEAVELLNADNVKKDVHDKKGRPQFGSATRVKTIAELKMRLEKLKGKKLDYQERLKKKGMKSRLMKKQRLEERAKLKKEKFKAKKIKGNLVKPKPSEDEKQDVEKPPVEPKLMFSKLELPQEEVRTKRENKDPKRTLQKIQKSQSKLKALESKGKTDTVKRIKEKLTWDKAIQKAEGVKIKDDVELLKKTIKKKSDIKARSKKKWDNRTEAIDHRQQESQKKRKENIKKKNKEKKQKKIKRSIKKGRIVI